MTEAEMKTQIAAIPPAEDDDLRGICFCVAPYHAPYCRIGVMLARMERPKGLFRVKGA